MMYTNASRRGAIPLIVWGVGAVLTTFGVISVSEVAQDAAAQVMLWLFRQMNTVGSRVLEWVWTFLPPEVVPNYGFVSPYVEFLGFFLPLDLILVLIAGYLGHLSAFIVFRWSFRIFRGG